MANLSRTRRPGSMRAAGQMIKRRFALGYVPHHSHQKPIRSPATNGGKPMEIPELLGMSEISSAPFQAIKTVGRLKALEWQRVSAIQQGHGYKLQHLLAQRLELVK